MMLEWFIFFASQLKMSDMILTVSLKTPKTLELCDRQILDQNLDFPVRFPFVTSLNEEFVDHKVSGSWVF